MELKIHHYWVRQEIQRYWVRQEIQRYWVRQEIQHYWVRQEIQHYWVRKEIQHYWVRQENLSSSILSDKDRSTMYTHVVMCYPDFVLCICFMTFFKYQRGNQRPQITQQNSRGRKSPLP